MMRLLLFVLAIVTSAVSAWAGPPPPTYTVEVPTFTFNDEQFLTGTAAEGTPAVVTATVKLATDEPGQPVVVLLHGSEGRDSSAVNGWYWTMQGWGYAVVRLDSYTGRGVTQISNAQDDIGQFIQIYDLYRLIEVLAMDPMIDASRIVVMGFSRGGNAALYGGLARFHELYGPAEGRIAALLPFYPACNMILERGDDMIGVPIREFHGSIDDWTPAAPCRAYVADLQAAGADIAMTEYDGAYHAFDASLAKAAVFLDDAQTSRNCVRREVDGILVNDATGQPFSYADACVERGVTVQYNEPATKSAQEAVAALLAEVFGS